MIAGPPSEQLWKNTRYALTVQSTVALQCASLGIPVFLCHWLRDLTSGYVEQFAKFGVGHMLDSSDELSEIPRLLEEDAQDGPDAAHPVGEPWIPRNYGICSCEPASFPEAIKA